MSPAMCWQNTYSCCPWVNDQKNDMSLRGALQVCQFIYSIELQTPWQWTRRSGSNIVMPWRCLERLIWIWASLPRRTKAVQHFWFLKVIMFSETAGFVALDRLSCNSKTTSLFMFKNSLVTDKTGLRRTWPCHICHTTLCAHLYFP